MRNLKLPVPLILLLAGSAFGASSSPTGAAPADFPSLSCLAYARSTLSGVSFSEALSTTQYIDLCVNAGPTTYRQPADCVKRAYELTQKNPKLLGLEGSSGGDVVLLCRNVHPAPTETPQRK